MRDAVLVWALLVGGGGVVLLVDRTVARLIRRHARSPYNPHARVTGPTDSAIADQLIAESARRVRTEKEWS